MEETARQSQVLCAGEYALEKTAAEINTMRRMLFSVNKRYIAFVLFTFTALLATGIMMINLKHVKIIAAGRTTEISTFSANPYDILSKNGILASKHDKVNFSGFKNNNATINVIAAVQVNVYADKKKTSVMVADGTVSDALEEANVTPGSEDIVSAPLDSTVSEGDTITVKRVTYQTKTTVKSIAYSVTKQTTALLSRGVEHQLQAGKTGKKEITTKVKYIDGQVAQKQTLKTTVKAKPVAKKLLVGTAASTPLSKLNFSNLKLNSNGVPVNYSRRISGLATAYSARSGALTASGRLAGVGYVAVNTKIIPYGTKLYIMTPDGSCVYGTAIAADTGTFTSDGSGIAVDLYFPSYASSCAFGERTVNIYVLK